MTSELGSPPTRQALVLAASFGTYSCPAAYSAWDNPLPFCEHKLYARYCDTAEQHLSLSASGFASQPIESRSCVVPNCPQEHDPDFKAAARSLGTS